MQQFEGTSLKTRLYVLVLVAFIPIALLILYLAEAQKTMEEEAVFHTITVLTRTAANEEFQQMESARALLVVLADAFAIAKDRMHGMVRAEQAEGLVIAEWVKDGNPADAIQSTVESQKVDLVLMLAHEEGRLEHFLFGKTNDAIIRQLPTTLMLVK
jgi:nucleotide-binding universal stress UspA family protein